MEKKRVLVNSVMTVLQTVVSGLTLFFLYRFLLSVIGVEQLGIWSLILATASVSQIVIFGLSGSIVKCVANDMVKAGCLVWVPAGGGQTEIVGRSDLIYSGPEDAVAKIGRVLEDGNLHAALRTHFEVRKTMFSVDRFVHDVRAVVTGFLRGHTGTQAS